MIPLTRSRTDTEAIFHFDSKCCAHFAGISTSNWQLKKCFKDGLKLLSSGFLWNLCWKQENFWRFALETHLQGYSNFTFKKEHLCILNKWKYIWKHIFWPLKNLFSGTPRQHHCQITKKENLRKTFPVNFSAWVEKWYYLFCLEKTEVKRNAHATSKWAWQPLEEEENCHFSAFLAAVKRFRWQFLSCWLEPVRELNSRVN